VVEVVQMALTEARKRANDKYIKENYKRLPVSYPNAFVEEVKQAAAACGLPMAAYVREALLAKMGKAEGE